MENLENIIRTRRSVRTFEDREIDANILDKLRKFSNDITNPYNIPIEFKFLNGKEQRLSCPVAIGTDLFAGAKIKADEHFNEAFGYSFEMFILYAQSLEIGTVWVGGTMDREAFERAMALADGELMPCMTPLGYPAKKMSIRESMMRKGIKADSRMNFDELFFKNDFDTPMTEDMAGKLYFPLEMIRLAPSAVNKQPWRLIVTDDAVHFYLKRSKGFGADKVDIQKVDMGIAMCHFALAAEETGINTEFIIADPALDAGKDTEYIASYNLL